MTPNLPAQLRLAADRLMEGVARAGVAERADRISQAYRAGRGSATVIKDAEDHGLEASGPWLKIPLIETQAFEVPTPDPAADEADDEHDRKLNS